jgi:lipopolysaccharide transport system permease protein
MKAIDTLASAFSWENYKDLLIVLIHKEIKVRYKSSVFGYLWSVASPLATAMVFYLAFKVVMRIQIDAYPLFLITGLFPWQWFSNSVSVSPVIFLSNASLIKKVCFPRNVLSLVNVLQDMIHFILAIPVIVLFMVLYHKSPSWTWLYGIPLLLVIQLCMTYGVAVAISSVNLFFRDMERLTGILLMLVFYCTPVIYPASMVPDKYHWLLAANPIAPLMINWRTLLMDGTLDPMYVGLSVGYAAAFLAIGQAIYAKLCWRFAEVL